jgi:hypothetical protein
MIECTFNYTSAGNRVFELYAGSTANTITISSDTAASPRISSKFILEYYGSNSTYTTTAGINNVDVFSAKVSAAGVVSGENVDWINGNATISDTSLFAVTFNTFTFTVAPNCVVTPFDNSIDRTAQIDSQSSTSVSVRTQTATTKLAEDFNIVCQKQGADFVASKTITGTFNEVMTAPGIAKPKTCYYAFGGASATLASPTECTTGTCVEVVDTCGTATPPQVLTGTGLYDNLTFANGTWSNSSFIHCSCTSYDTTSDEVNQCSPRFVTGDQTWSTTTNGGLVLNLDSSSDSGTGKFSYMSVECTGVAP